MTRLNYRRLLAWWAAVATLLVLIAAPPSAEAQSSDCPAVDMNELPRECTFLEEHGMCLTNAYDSYYSCVDSADNWWDRLVCEGGVQVDLLACNVAMPWTLLKMIVT